jgi:carboxyl-terminal processing protease
MRLISFLRNRSSQLTTSVIIAMVFAAGFALGNQYAVGAAQSQFTAPPEAEEAFAPFWQVYNLIKDDYVDPEGDPVDEQALVDGAIKGMVDSLDDQFSGYMDAEEFPMVNQELEGEIEGIGVVIRTVEETNEIEIVSVMQESPAERAGILAGDVFAIVNEKDATVMNQMELAQEVRGPAGTTVNITMRRGEEMVDFTVMRALIIIPLLESRLLDNNIGYIHLNQFGPGAREEIDTALDEMNAPELDGLVLDLRGNPGGLLTTAVEVGSAFIDDGLILTEDFGDYEQPFETNGSFNGLDVPMVVLVDEASASASELIAGALQDNHRATIIGETTFGKGTVQTWQHLVNGGGIRLTIARWLTPNGNWIHDLGITPDIVVDWDPNSPEEYEDDIQLDAAVDFLATQVSAQEPQLSMPQS